LTRARICSACQFSARGHRHRLLPCFFNNHPDQPKNAWVIIDEIIGDEWVLSARCEQVLGQVVGPDAHEIGARGKVACAQSRSRRFDHGSQAWK